MGTQEKLLYTHNPVIHFLATMSHRIFNWVDETFIGKDTFNPAQFEITDTALTLPRLPAAFDGYRIAHISDIHIDTWLGLERLEHVIEMVNAQRADLVVITGDFITYHVPHLTRGMEPLLRNLHAPDGVMAVLGNHDYWAAPDDVRRMLRNAGIREMGNRVHTLQRGDDRLHIAGLDDVYNKHDHLNSILRHLPLDGAAILLVHVPDFADVAAATGRFDLCLSGHTHGGQMVLPFSNRPLVLPPYGKKYHSGLYRIGEMYQYTTRGLGTSTVAIRINCPPEISILTLHSPLA